MVKSNQKWTQYLSDSNLYNTISSRNGDKGLSSKTIQSTNVITNWQLTFTWAFHWYTTPLHHERSTRSSGLPQHVLVYIFCEVTWHFNHQLAQYAHLHIPEIGKDKRNKLLAFSLVRALMIQRYEARGWPRVMLLTHWWLVWITFLTMVGNGYGLKYHRNVWHYDTGLVR